MASLFEQYEQSAQKSADLMTAARFSRPDNPISSSSVQLMLNDTEPIFNKRRMFFRPTAPVTCLAVSNGHLVLAMANKTLLRLELSKADQKEEIDLTKFGGEQHIASKVRRLFLDFTGHHLLISLTGREADTPVDTLYLHHGSKKPRSVNKMKPFLINAVAWGRPRANENSSGPLLVGTNKGIIYETCLVSVDEKYGSLNPLGGIEQYWKQLFDLSKGEATSVTGLEYHLVPGGHESKCFILVTTPSRIYYFLGSIPSLTDYPIMIHVFNKYSDISVRYLDLPSTLPSSQLQFFYPNSGGLPKAFAWMTGVGTMYGGLDYSGQAGPNTLITEQKLLVHPKDDDSNQLPISIVLTEFHIALLYKDRVRVICVLNEQMILEDVFTEDYGEMVQLVKDPANGNIWACSSYAVYRYNVTREARHVWQIYLDAGEYTLAKNVCQNDATIMDIVLTRQAEDYFSRKNYEESAIHYAMTRVAFEEVVLKFLQLPDKNAVKTYLTKKLSQLGTQDKTQTTMIVTLLIELFLNQMGVLRDAGLESSTRNSEELKFFLETKNVKECTSNNRNTIYDLIQSHGDQKTLIDFALIIEDHKKVVEVNIQNGNYTMALSMLQKEKRVDLFYQFCPVLLQYIPRDTVDALIALGRKVESHKLIPAFVLYNSDRAKLPQKNEVVRYLEFCVAKLDNKDHTIHNYLLSLYTKYLPEMLQKYLSSQGQDAATICYDMEYALRICSEYSRDWACVHIYSVMGLFEEAVDLALKFDIELAKHNANRPEDDEELRKKLWLKIAHHVVKEQNDIKQAMAFLQECDLIKIEDILPFFPNFVTIDHFQSAICQSLQEYNQHIETLKEEMEEATQSTKEIRSEIKEFKNQNMVIGSQDKCAKCSYLLLTRSFYVFPCRHMFHAECLTSELLPHLGVAKRNLVEDLRKQLATFGNHEEVAPLASSTSGVPALTTREKLKADLDDILASECPYCGDIMIRTIDTPFIDPQEYDDVVKGWE